MMNFDIISAHYSQLLGIRQGNMISELIIVAWLRLAQNSAETKFGIVNVMKRLSVTDDQTNMWTDKRDVKFEVVIYSALQKNSVY